MSALEVRFSRRGAIQIYVYLYLLQYLGTVKKFKKEAVNLTLQEAAGLLGNEQLGDTRQVTVAKRKQVLNNCRLHHCSTSYFSLVSPKASMPRH